MHDPHERPSAAVVKALLRLSWQRFGHTIGRMPKVLPNLRQPTRGKLTTTPLLAILLGLLMLVQSFFFTRQMVGHYADSVMDRHEDLVKLDAFTYNYLKSRDEAGDRSSEMTFSILKSYADELSIPPEEAFEQFQQKGIAGFRLDSEFSWNIARIAELSAEDRAPFDRLIGTVLLSTLCALLFMPLALRDRDLAATNGHLEWLFSLPLKGSEILIGKFASSALIRPLFYLVLWPMLVNLLSTKGYGFPLAAGLGLVVGFLISVALSGIDLMLDTWLRARASARLVRNLQMLLMIFGQLAFYAVMAACIASGPSFPWVAWLAAGPIGDLGMRLSALAMASPAVMIGSTLAVALACGFGGLLVSSRLLRGGLHSGSGQRTNARRMADQGVKVRQPMPFEWLLLLRDRTLATQIIAMPLLLVVYHLLINPDLLKDATVVVISSIAFFCGTYASLVTAPQLLASEAKGAWLIYNLPLPVSTYFRRREQIWRTMLTALAGLLALVMLLVSGNFAIGKLWHHVAALAGVWVIGRVVSGIVMGKPQLPDAISGARPKISIGRTYGAMMLVGLYGALLYQGKPWPLVSALVIFWFLGAAIWQRREISFLYLTEPTEKEPPSWGVDDALWGVFVFLLFQSLSLMILGYGPASDGMAILISFLIGGVAAIGFAHWRRTSKGLPLPQLWNQNDPSSNPGRSKTIVETAIAAIICITAGGLWQWVIQTGAIIDPESLKASRLPISQPMVWVLAVIAAPLMEEPLFRGFVCRTMTGFWSRWRSILGSALVFAVIHPGISFPPVFVLGIATALLYLRSRSLVPPIILHAIYNLAALAIASGIAK